jgi:hypothetical protein
MPGFSKILGTWQSVTNYYTKVAGQWKTVSAVYTKVDGVWRLVFPTDTPPPPPSLSTQVCISVIDETVQDENSNWLLLKQQRPNVPLFCLVPGNPPSRIENLPPTYTPENLGFGPTTVNRDNGNTSLASDWFTICGLNAYSPGTQIVYSIDTSGSMRESTVQASLALFLQKLSDAGLVAIRRTMSNERWIEPFVNLPVAPPPPPPVSPPPASPPPPTPPPPPVTCTPSVVCGECYFVPLTGQYIRNCTETFSNCTTNEFIEDCGTPPTPPPPPPPTDPCTGVTCPPGFACFLGFCEFVGSPPPPPPVTPPPPPANPCTGVVCPPCYACYVGFCEFIGCPEPPSPPPATPPASPPPSPPPATPPPPPPTASCCGVPLDPGCFCSGCAILC